MSLIPVDESERGGSGGDTGDSEGSPASPVARAVGRVAGAVGALGRTLRSGLATLSGRRSDRRSTESGATGVNTDQTDVDTDPTGLGGPVELSADDTPALDGPETVQALPERESLALAGPETDRPELTARRDDDELTLQVSGEPEARITSDVWEDVEP
jgi:hypothetical protein